MPPQFSRFRAFSSQMVTFTGSPATAFLASSARSAGAKAFGGVFTKSRLSFTASAITLTSATSAFCASVATPGTSSTMFATGAAPLAGLDLKEVNEYAAREAPSAAARSTSSCGATATATFFVPVSARIALPLATRNASRSRPLRISPIPTATMRGALMPVMPATLVTSPDLPVAPRVFNAASSLVLCAVVMPCAASSKPLPLGIIATTSASQVVAETAVVAKVNVMGKP